MNLYSVPTLRERLGRLRFFIYKRFRGIDLLQTEKALHWDYSKNQFERYLSNKDRVNYLITLVSKISGSKNSNRTLLSCGPRYESELYGFRGLGFKWSNIHAIDIFSYSPKIKLGDIHALNFDPNSFDLIVCGWVIAYSAEPELALKQFHRVLKTGGKVIITWELPLTFSISDNLNLSLHRKSDINDDDSILSDGLILPIASKYFKIHRVEIGKLHFNNDVLFAVLVLEK